MFRLLFCLEICPFLLSKVSGDKKLLYCSLQETTINSTIDCQQKDVIIIFSIKLFFFEILEDYLLVETGDFTRGDDDTESYHVEKVFLADGLVLFYANWRNSNVLCR